MSRPGDRSAGPTRGWSGLPGRRGRAALPRGRVLRRSGNATWEQFGTLVGTAAGWTRQGVRELGALDRAVYEAVATVPTPSLDRTLARLSDAADHSKLWLAGAGVLALAGGARGRRAALAGVASVGMSSAVSNILIKRLLPRRRPDRTGATVPEVRWVRMPTSLSFPSGHSASAFAFASAVGSGLPQLSLPLHLAATAVAYSRVHTGVHYPGDAIAGALLGTAAAALVRQFTRA
jgi:membrane-associated phospholipid phosphatase